MSKSTIRHPIYFEVPEAFKVVADSALARLSYLHPSVNFTLTDWVIEARTSGAVDEEVLRRDVWYALCREKIFVDTRGLREALVAAVMK